MKAVTQEQQRWMHLLLKRPYKLGMKPGYKDRYLKEVGTKTLRVGTYSAPIVILASAYFWYTDINELGLEHTFVFRALGFIGGLIFFLAYLRPTKPQHIFLVYSIMLSFGIIMMHGIVFQVFSLSESSSIQQYGSILGSIMAWMAMSLIAQGVRFIMVIIGSIIVSTHLLIMIWYPPAEAGGMVITLFFFAAFGMVLMFMQERQERNKAVVVYELEEREEEVRQQREALQRANENLKGFNYTVSHDLKGPVRRAYSYAQVLESQLEKQAVELKGDYIQRIKNNLKRGYGIIEDLMMLSRVGEAAIDWDKLNLDELIDTIWQEQTEALDDSRKILFQKANLGSIYGDKKLLWHVFSNLISNAVKYSSRKAEAQIEIGLIDQGDDDKTIYIKDNGAGFDSDFAKIIGKPFKRFHSGEDFEGTGVGLAIVKQIIKLHKGEFWAEGEIGVGATFYCKLPCNEFSDSPSID